MSESGKKGDALFGVCGLYFLAAAGLWLVSLFGDGLPSGGTQEQSTLLFNLVYYVPFILVPCLLYMSVGKDRARVFRLNPITLGDTLRLSFIAIVVVLIAQNLSLIWMALWEGLGVNVADTTYVRPANTSELTLSILSTAALAPVCEEILFRGVILSGWSVRGDRQALFVSTLLFALMHGNLLGLPAELFGGMIIGLLVLTSDSLYAGMVCHSVYNAAVVILNYMATDPAVAATADADMMTLIGGVGGIVLLLLETLVMGMVCFMLFGKYLRRYVMKNMPEDLTPEGLLARPRALLGEPRTCEPLSVGTVVVMMAGIVSGAAMMIITLIPRIGG